jgi:predicted nucleic acid-binding protein
MVIAEAAYLVDRQLGAKAEASLDASIIEGQMEVADLDIDNWQHIQDLVTTYADLRLGGTDASVVALAKRCRANRIATLNRRHFAAVRPRHADAFELLP